MIYRAYSSDTVKLLSLPETGMGYQVIEAKRTNESAKTFIVYNGELIVDLDSSSFSDFKKQIKTSSFSRVLEGAIPWTFATESISLVPKTTIQEKRALSDNLEKYKHRHRGGRGAKDNAKEYANGSEWFVRLSAYENDLRIDFEKKKLKKGSYTTTWVDYAACIQYVDDPIDRYALPNDEQIKWAFYICPKILDEFQRGIVQPAFEHEGGGIEAYFEKGTSDGTFLEKKPYGQ